MKKFLFTLLRLAWLAFGFFLWLYWLASLPRFLHLAALGALPIVEINNLSPAQLATEGAAAWQVSIAAWSWINLLINGLSFLVFSLVALLIWWRVRTGFGLLTAYIFLVGGSAFMNVAIFSAELSQTALTVWQMGAVIWPLFFLWLYLFPNGQAIPRRLLWLIGPLLSLFTLFFALDLISTFLPGSSQLRQVVDTLNSEFSILVLPLIFAVFAAQVYRYVRVSGETEKKQTKWFLFGLTIALILPQLMDLLIDYPVELGTLAFTALPIGIGISILRYRLWDIDVIIRKTIIYAALTGLLALIYFGMVLLLQTIVDTVSSQQSPIVIVISTLAIAALFAPLRRRVQAVIDRRFFRKKYDAQQVLTQFAQTARDETDMEMLRAEMIRVVEETLQPEKVSMWLNEGKR